MKAASLCLLSALASTACAAEFKTDGDGFIRDWLLGGAYPSYWVDSKPQGFDEDFLVKFGGEAAAEPFAGMKDEALFKADWGKLVAGVGSTNEWGWTQDRTLPVSWRPLHWDKAKAIIELDKMFDPVDDHIVSYASCYIDAPERMKVKFRLGSDDDHKLYLNGVLIGKTKSSQGIIPDNFIYDAELERGLNRVLLKVVDRTGGYGFCVSLSDRKDKPLSDLPVLIEHPGRKLLATLPGLKGVDAYDHGFFAGFNFESGNLFVGRRRLEIQAGSLESVPCKLLLAGSLGGRTVFKHESPASVLEPGRILTWPVEVALPAGELRLELTVASPEGKVLAVLTKTLAVYDPAKVKAGIAELKAQLGHCGKEAEDSIASEAKAMEGKISQLRLKRGGLFAKIEAAYAGARAKLSSTPKAVVDEPLKAASTARLRTCLNGDQWLMAAAKGDCPSVGAAEWRACSLPLVCFNEYFRSWFVPVIEGKGGKRQASPGWDGYQFNELICAKSLWFMKEISLGQEPGSEAYSLICENASGRMKVYVNGTLCGDYHGDIGVLEFPLKGLKPGANILALRMDLDGKTLQNASWGWGPRGDFHLERSPLVRVSDVEVKTSWRKASLSVGSELENRGATAAKVRLEQYCVLDGRVKYRLAPVEASLDPGSKAALSSSGVWTEAEPWGIGGDYGKPTLYEMVSDLYVDGKLLDRRTDSFGFREFWIAGSDFYLNGRRILLQGDVGVGLNIASRKFNDVMLPLLRADGINLVRNHDAAHYSPEFLRSCDQQGMLAYVQMFPVLHDGNVSPDMKKHSSKLIPFEEWLTHPLHQYNLENYARWVKLLRNHPSVVIVSTDNEIFTQAWDSLEQEAFNIRNDRLGAWYGRYVKSLNPDFVMTRDGDEGTWCSSFGKWREDPPCDTANYHYPDFNLDLTVRNWQSIYGFRPVIFGETLYCRYFNGQKWVGASPDLVAKRARQLSDVAAFYRREEIPCVVYMGLDSDGFVQLDDSGKGNPWGITRSMRDAFNGSGVAPEGPKRYPWAKVEWPSLAGPGIKKEAIKLSVDVFGSAMINWFDETVPSHVRNAVNEAYRDALIPQPPLAAPSDAECLADFGQARRGKVVTARSGDGLSEPVAVTADSRGVAWFRLGRAGDYLFECEGESLKASVPSRASFSRKPGFNLIPSFKSN